MVGNGVLKLRKINLTNGYVNLVLFNQNNEEKPRKTTKILQNL